MVRELETDSRELLGSVYKHIAIKPGYRGQGIGRGMIYEFIKENGILLLTAETDKDAVGFYRKIGFSVRSLGEKYPGVERFECKLSSGITKDTVR